MYQITSNKNILILNVVIFNILDQNFCTKVINTSAAR